MKTITLRISPELHAEVVEAAAIESVSISAFLRRSVIRGVERTRMEEMDRQAEIARRAVPPAEVLRAKKEADRLEREQVAEQRRKEREARRKQREAEEREKLEREAEAERKAKEQAELKKRNAKAAAKLQPRWQQVCSKYDHAAVLINNVRFRESTPQEDQDAAARLASLIRNAIDQIEYQNLLTRDPAEAEELIAYCEGMFVALSKRMGVELK